MAEKTAPQLLSGELGEGAQADLSRKGSLLPYKTARRMRKDPTIALGRWLVSAPVIASPWSFEVTKDAPEGAAEELETQLQPLRVHLLRTVLYGFLDYGWQGFEKVLDLKPAGHLYCKKLKPLMQDMTDIQVFTDTGGFAGFVNGEVELTLDESLLFSFEPEGTDWYGTPILENSRQPWEQWDQVELAAKRYDMKMAGTHLVVKFPDDGEGVNEAIAKKLVGQWQASGAVTIPVALTASDDISGWDVQLMSDNGSGRGQFVERQMYLDKLKVRGLGLPERAVLEGEYGTKADAESHADFAILNLELRHQDIVQTINWHLINQLLRLNYGEQFENTVFIKPAPITDESKKFLRDVYKQWLSLPDGQLLESNRLDLDGLREQLGIPSVHFEEQPTDIIPATTGTPTTTTSAVPDAGGVAAETTLNGAQITAAVEVLAGLTAKTIVPIAATELLVAVGIPRDKAGAIVQATTNPATAPLPTPTVPGA